MPALGGASHPVMRRVPRPGRCLCGAADERGLTLNAKIRDAQLDLVPYMLVVGPKDQQQGGVSVRDRIDGDLGFLSLQGAIAKLTEERDGRVIRQVSKRPLAAAASDGAAANEY